MRESASFLFPESKFQINFRTITKQKHGQSERWQTDGKAAIKTIVLPPPAFTVRWLINVVNNDKFCSIPYIFLRVLLSFHDRLIEATLKHRLHGLTKQRLHGLTKQRLLGLTKHRTHGLTKHRMHGLTSHLHIVEVYDGYVSKNYMLLLYKVYTTTQRLTIKS